MKLVVLLCAFLLSACSNHIYLPSSFDEAEYGNNLLVYVENPELKREYEILKFSKIFELSPDSSIENKVILNELHPMLFCGNPLVLTTITLGLIPGSVPDDYLYSFKLKGGDTEVEYSYTLRVISKYSIYESLKFWRPTDDEILAQALNQSYHEN